MKKNKLYLLSLIILFFSCSRIKKNNQLNAIATKYIEEYPIGLKNYDYIIRFYKKNNDTILEINQDRIDVIRPIDFIFNEIDTTDIDNPRHRFIKIGNTKINNKQVFIFDTYDTIGKKLYSNLKIKKEEHKIDEVSHLNYPWIPKTRIYKFKNNNLIFLEEIDTVR